MSVLKRKLYLATTGISEIWDLNNEIVFLGPWCLTDQKSKTLVKEKAQTLILSPWHSKSAMKVAESYCQQLYEDILPKLSICLNSIHGVSYSVKYWRVLVGPWFQAFIGVLYDRFKRVEKTLELYPDFYTHVLPSEDCIIVPADTRDFSEIQVTQDYYNLKILSILFNYLCPANVEVKKIVCHEAQEKKRHTLRFLLKNGLIDIYNYLLLYFFRPSCVLTDMYHLSTVDMLRLSWKAGLKKMSVLKSRVHDSNKSTYNYSKYMREKIYLEPEEKNTFFSILAHVIPSAIPACYIENYEKFKKEAEPASSAKIVGSAVGWFTDERFKFYAANAVSKGARLIDFQHGGGYGQFLFQPAERLSLEKDIFYSWGWSSMKNGRVKPLPSPHLSKIKNTYFPIKDSILFVGGGAYRYTYRLHSYLQPEDMNKYMDDKKLFIMNLSGNVRRKILYRPYGHEFGWRERETILDSCPEVQFPGKGKLVRWMQKVGMVIVDHPGTGCLEALSINVPCIFYWDHDIFLMRPEAERYFDLLREVGILHRDPLSAANKINEVFNDPVSWWMQDDIQNARMEFCNRFAYADKDWLDIWVKELNYIEKIVNC